MAAAVNQNDLIEIVKAQVDSFNDIITIVVKNAPTINKLDEGLYKATMSAVDYTKNIVNSISGFYKEVKTSKSNEYKTLIKSLREFEKISEKILKIFKILVKFNRYKGRIHIDQIVKFIDALPPIRDAVKKLPKVGFGTMLKIVAYIILVGLIGLLAVEMTTLTVALGPGALAAQLLAVFAKKLATAIIWLKKATKELIKFTFYMAILMPFLPMTRLGLINLAHIIPSMMLVVRMLIRHVAKSNLAKFFKLNMRLRRIIALYLN